MSKFLSIILFSIVTIFSNTLSYALDYDIRHVDELYEKSDIVAIVDIIAGEVLDVNGEVCGARYLANVKKFFKGNSSIPLLNFGRNVGLKVGNEYLVFLRDEKSIDRYYSSSGLKKLEKLSRGVRKLISCRGIIPGLLINEMGIYVINSGTFNVLETNIVFPKKVRIDSNGKIKKAAIIDYISTLK